MKLLVAYPNLGYNYNMKNVMGLIEFFQQYPDDAAAERHFTAARWPDGAVCPHCQSTNIQTGAKHPHMPYRCRGCRKFFSVRVGTLMQSSNLSYQQWLLALYLLQTGKKGISSLDLARRVGCTQKAAWHLAHRLRDADT